jgi:hypothetical protein
MAKKSAGDVNGRINHPLRVQSKEVSATVASYPGDVDPNRKSHQLVSAWNASLTHRFNDAVELRRKHNCARRV